MIDKNISWAVWAQEDEPLHEKTEKVKIVEEYFKEKIYPTTHHQKEITLNLFLRSLEGREIRDWEGEVFLIGSFLTETDNAYSDVDLAMTTYGVFSPSQAHDLFSIQKQILHNRGIFVDILHTSILEDPNRPLLVLELDPTLSRGQEK